MADEFIKYRRNINYVEYILKNPLYIHNNLKRNYFKQTVDNLDNMGVDPIAEAEDLYERYLFYLKEREENILASLGGQEVLDRVIDEAFISNVNISGIIKTLKEVFYMGKDIKSSVSKISGDEENRYLRITTGTSGKKRKDLVDPIQLVIDSTNPTSEKHGRVINNYNYKASAKLVNKYQRQALLDIVREIQVAINSQEEINTKINEFVNNDILSKKITDKASPFFQYIKKAMSFHAKSSNAELLEFIVDKMGTFSALTGQFTEAAEINFSDGLKDLIDSNFSAQRGDIRSRAQRQGTFKKPDLILSGGTILENLNPITVSMKTISNERDIKVQNSPLMGKGDGGIYQAFAKDSPNVAKLYLYLMLNNSYYENDKAFEIINLLNKYMSYIFISGNIKTSLGGREIPANQAVYMVINQNINSGVKTSFIPISSIIEAMKEGDIRITNTKKSTNNLMPLWYTKLNAIGFKRQNSKRLRNLTYENLYNNKLVIDKAKNIVDSLLTRDRKIDIRYNVIRGIIT